MAPATLVGNWENEVKRWLGSERLRVRSPVGAPGCTLRNMAPPAAHLTALASPLRAHFRPVVRRRGAAMLGAQVFVLGQQQDAAQRVQQFRHGTVERLCITSYETLRKHAAALAGACQLLVCDEGHRCGGGPGGGCRARRSGRARQGQSPAGQRLCGM